MKNNVPEIKLFLFVVVKLATPKKFDATSNEQIIKEFYRPKTKIIN